MLQLDGCCSSPRCMKGSRHTACLATFCQLGLQLARTSGGAWLGALMVRPEPTKSPCSLQLARGLLLESSPCEPSMMRFMTLDLNKVG